MSTIYTQSPHRQPCIGWFFLLIVLSQEKTISDKKLHYQEKDSNWIVKELPKEQAQKEAEREAKKEARKKKQMDEESA